MPKRMKSHADRSLIAFKVAHVYIRPGNKHVQGPRRSGRVHGIQERHEIAAKAIPDSQIIQYTTVCMFCHVASEGTHK
jgi:hypothetical protein